MNGNERRPQTRIIIIENDSSSKFKPRSYSSKSHVKQNRRIVRVTPKSKLKRKSTFTLFNKRKNVPQTETKVVPDVSIPGVNKLFDPKYSVIGKIIWGLAVLVCAAVCFSQIQSRVQLYHSAPLTITVNVTRFSTYPFPAVTVCPFYPFRYKASITALKKRYAEIHNNFTDIQDDDNHLSLLDLPDINATILWELAGIGDENISASRLCEFVNKKNCHMSVNISHVETFLGTCTMFALTGKIDYDGSYNGIEIRLKTPAYDGMYWKFTVLLHELNDRPKHLLYFEVGQMVHPQFETNLMVTMKQYFHANSTVNRCQERKDYEQCYWNCIEPRMIENSSCKLPYVSFPNELPFCISFQEAIKFYQQTKDVYNSIPKLCHVCVRKCKEDIYGMIQDVIRPRNDTIIKVLLTDNVVEVVQEHEYYTIESLVADIGGNLGLFLGFCLLTILQILEICALKLRNYIVYITFSTTCFKGGVRKVRCFNSQYNGVIHA